MSKSPHVPPTPGNGTPQGVEIPAIELSQCRVQTGPHPKNPQLKAILIGPIFLVLPFDAVAARSVVKGLTGIEVASAGDKPQ